MSFDFSDLFVPDNNDENDNNDYTQFLADPIYDWLNSPEEVLQAIDCKEWSENVSQVCDKIEEEKKKKRKVTIIQQPQPQNTVTWKKVLYRRGPYRKKKDRNN